ncbi:hypothetical protein SAMN05428642_101466 [Flaviramulus basaltis]|uniref:TonB family C-terminal domain-containing protein n=1 Tax=Flaviramulus basaltis TaxID=369401 RepID=A0A1K2IBH3_9FLAO|nr:hypothetical protein [Flaviramulus basaltis]SFZ89626.1 hypothetical protein SAMN05428642_101466 [Flaviramulus basaltis]
MNFTNQHKALLITFFLSGTVVLSVFNFGLKKQSEIASESYYEIEPEKELTKEEIKVLEALESLNNAKAETNDAFNETQKSKQFAQAYKTIAPPEDYVPKSSSVSDGPNTAKRNYDDTEDSKLNDDELTKFSKVNELLKKQRSGGNNSKSTISFSLKNRTKVYIPIPVYLCEFDGKITVNITVNSDGNVTDAYVNSSSTSDNECLIEHALEYAKQSLFSTDASKETQIGTITFYFIGKQ